MNKYDYLPWSVISGLAARGYEGAEQYIKDTALNGDSGTVTSIIVAALQRQKWAVDVMNAAVEQDIPWASLPAALLGNVYHNQSLNRIFNVNKVVLLLQRYQDKAPVMNYFPDNEAVITDAVAQRAIAADDKDWSQEIVIDYINGHEDESKYQWARNAVRGAALVDKTWAKNICKNMEYYGADWLSDVVIECVQQGKVWAKDLLLEPRVGSSTFDAPMPDDPRMKILFKLAEESDGSKYMQWARDKLLDIAMDKRDGLLVYYELMKQSWGAEAVESYQKAEQAAADSFSYSRVLEATKASEHKDNCPYDPGQLNSDTAPVKANEAENNLEVSEVVDDAKLPEGECCNPSIDSKI